MKLALSSCLAGAAMLVLSGPVLAHEGHDHGADPVHVTTVLPRAQAQSDDFELVAVAHADRVMLYLDRFATNEPVAGARLEADLGSRRLVALERDEGTYELVLAASAGRVALTVSVEAGDAVDLLPLLLEVPAQAAPVGSRVPRWAWLAGGSMLLLGVGGLAWRARRTRGRLDLPALFLALPFLALALPGVDARADAPRGASSAPPAEPPQRLPDGGVFVPKPVQRLYGLRTVVGEAAELPRVLELKGHVLPDPNAGGQVQALVGGRIEPGPKGLPVLGQRVVRGEVLAWVTPARDPLARASLRGQVAELDGRLDAALRRVARLEQLEGSVARRDIDNARIELEALRVQRRVLGHGVDAREPLIAPVAGVVSAAHAVAGKVVDARELLFEIVDPQRLVVEAVAYDAAVAAALAPGTTGAAPDAGARLVFVGAGRALREQAIPLLFRFVAPVPPLPTGQPVRVVVPSGVRVTGVALPSPAVVRTASGDTVVWVHVSAERFEPRRVEALPLDAARLVVAKGLTGGERVVVEGAALLGQVR